LAAIISNSTKNVSFWSLLVEILHFFVLILFDWKKSICIMHKKERKESQN
jgi:hypothetical protein